MGTNLAMLTSESLSIRVSTITQTDPRPFWSIDIISIIGNLADSSYHTLRQICKSFMEKDSIRSTLCLQH